MQAGVIFRLPNEKRIHAFMGEEFHDVSTDLPFPCMIYTTLLPLGKWSGIRMDRACNEHDIAFELSAYTGKDGSYTEEEYKALVNDTVDRIQRGGLTKVVHSRWQFFPTQVPPLEIFYHLENAFPTAFVYLLHSPRYGVWCGASPETLLRNENGVWRTMALAGTRMVGAGTDWTDKEYREQQVVSEEIKSILREEDLSFDESDVRTIATGKIEHLCTEFRMDELKDPANFSLKLHPTSAVCGFPRADASVRILSVEGDSRELYTGMIGWMESSDYAQVFVNLRCMRIFSNGIRLHAGGGINAQSDAQHEWDETVNKMNNVLKAAWIDGSTLQQG